MENETNEKITRLKELIETAKEIIAELEVETEDIEPVWFICTDGHQI